jgi:putative mRNA 3-end processing factor
MSSLKLRRQGTGIVLKYMDVTLALDTGLRGMTTLLSHSHSDHIGGVSDAPHIIATSGTLDTLEARGTVVSGRRAVVKYGETLGTVGAYVTALNAGHVLGSTMFHIEFDDGLEVLYTGDFNAVDSIVHSAAEPRHADVLITEATYGTPRWVFPDRPETHRRILDAARATIDNGGIPVFQAYSLGKAQEAIALLQGAGIDVVSGNSTVDSVSEVYNKHGKGLAFAPLDSEDAKLALSSDCAIVTSSPRYTVSSIRKIQGAETARQIDKRIRNFNLSGWTLGEVSRHGFPLSAHTDFPGLIEFAKQVEPRMTYCFTGNGPVLSSHLIRAGVQAAPIE